MNKIQQVFVYTANCTIKLNLNRRYLYKFSLSLSECESYQRRVYLASLDDGKNA